MPERDERSSQQSISMVEGLADSGTAHTCANWSAVLKQGPEVNAVAAVGNAVPSRAIRKQWSEIDTAKNLPSACTKLSRWTVPAGLNISVGLRLTEGAPSALEIYAPDKTNTKDAFSCACKGTSSARSVGDRSDTEKPGSSR